MTGPPPLEGPQALMTRSLGIPWRAQARRRPVRRYRRWPLVVLALLLSGGFLTENAGAAEALILGRNVRIREMPHSSAKVIKMAHSGETYEVIGRKPGKGQPLYLLDERGDLWVKVRVAEDAIGFIRMDLVSVAREEFRSPRGNPRLIVNLRPTAEGAVTRELWVVHADWQFTRRLAFIEGRPVWASHGEWFISQVDSEQPVKDDTMERTIERIERFSADGRTRTLLAAGSYPVFHEPSGEVYFYRDVDEQGEPVPPGLFAVNVDGSNLRPLFLLTEGFRFWKEDGDFFVQAPPPALSLPAKSITLSAFDRGGSRVRITVTLDGQIIEIRPG